jgi:nucleoside-diphosphate-sugar epimerase
MAQDVIIVTGSAGRIGASVCKRLGDKYRIVGFELLKALYASANEELIPVDIGSDESVQQALNHIRHFYGNRIASVVHLAAYYSFNDQKYDRYKAITVKGTERLIKGLQDFEVEQFIFSSTMLVHKPSRPGQKISEEWPVVPNWAYPRSKVEAEEVLHRERGKIPVVNMRISGVYDDQCHSIPISQQIQRIYEKQLEARVFSGDTSHGAAFMHMDDLVDAIVLAVEKRKVLPPETTVLLGEPKTLSYDQMQRKISKLLTGKEISTIRVPKLFAKLGAWALNHIPFKEKPFIKPWMIDLADDHYELDISRAERLLGWKPKRSVEETLSKMIALLKADPQKWYKINGLRYKK